MGGKYGWRWEILEHMLVRSPLVCGSLMDLVVMRAEFFDDVLKKALKLNAILAMCSAALAGFTIRQSKAELK